MSLRSVVRTSLTWCCASLGLVVHRVGEPAPPTLAGYLRGLRARGVALDCARCIDGDVRVQYAILDAFGDDRARFGSDLARIEPEPGCGSWMCELDGGAVSLEDLPLDAPVMSGVGLLLLRFTLSAFWSGRGDLLQIERLAATSGFVLDDVIYALEPGGLDAPNQSVFLAFVRRNVTLDSAGGAVRHRRARARAYLSAPLAESADLERLVGRGYLGFDAGLLNPGALFHDGQLLLLARGERYPWQTARFSADLFLGGCQPVVLTLDTSLRVTGATPCDRPSLGAGFGQSRAEDFRIFSFRGQLFSNHSVVTIGEEPPKRGTPLRTESLRSTVMVSQLDVAQAALTPVGVPVLDRPTRDNEKNWVFFEHRGDLHLIYSFEPYHVLKATDWPALSFDTVIRDTVGDPFGDGLAIRNSVNPVAYDDEAFLHVIHRVYPGKQYVFWAVLLCKKTLRPSMISARPLVRAWQSSPSAIVYVSALVATEDEVVVFAGLDDSSTACWRIPRSRLDANWTPWPTA